jgi:cupin fold WbuC family metalloprotein
MTRLKRLDAALLDDLSRQALTSPRLRDNYNFHPRPDDHVQRLCIALEPDSYVRPHRHPEADKWEFLVALRGRVLLLLFDDDGCVTERLTLQPTGDVTGLEIAPNTWHTLLAEDSGTVVLEVKQGPYIPVSFSNFADWSPRESSSDVARYQTWCRTANLGDYYYR